MKISSLLLAALPGIVLLACDPKEKGDQVSDATNTQLPATPDLPAPGKSEKRFSNVIGWPKGKMPAAPAGFVVSEFARDLVNPRWIYVAPNGDVLVAESNTEKKGTKKAIAVVSGQAKSQRFDQSANRITLFRDTNNDGKPDLRKVFVTGLNQPFGMLIQGNYFYVANTDGLMRFPYQTGATSINGPGTKIKALPAGGYNNHWTRNILASPDGKKMYVSVGSGSNVGENGMEHEVKRAAVWEMNLDGSGERLYATGLRNPVGLAWYPGTADNKKPTLYAAVNERDELGDELVPDYLTSVKEGGFYGWPYAYYNKIEDPRRKGERPDLIEKMIEPDVPLGAHTASLGLAFYQKPTDKTATTFSEKYQNGAFIGQHGSWNRSKFSGYKVVFVPFGDGKPSGAPEDFLTGFIASDKDVYGRPVGVTMLPDGSMLVADDSGNRIWRVAAK